MERDSNSRFVDGKKVKSQIFSINLTIVIY